MVLAPEHPLVEELTAAAWPPDLADDARAAWTGGHATRPRPSPPTGARPEARSDVERQVEGREKTGVFLGRYATNPATGGQIPVFIADYVLMGYGTGAIMAVPGQDERDWEFAEAFGLPIVRTVQPPDGWHGPGLRRRGPGHQQRQRRGRPERPRASPTPSAASSAGSRRTGAGSGTVTTRLRDWLFSRQRFWGEPFPIVYDPDDGLPRALPRLDAAGGPARPRGLLPDHLRRRRRDLHAGAAAGPGDRLGRGDARSGRGPRRRYRRETNTMPQWAGSCWYELRYLDPDQRPGARRPRERALLDGPAVRGRLRRRRPVRRRGRARRAAPAVRPLLAQGALRPRATYRRSSRTGGCSTRA